MVMDRRVGAAQGGIFSARVLRYSRTADLRLGKALKNRER